MRVRKITYGGVLIAMAILLPQAFHLTGLAQTGKLFLPMHIPVLLSGFLLGPVYGGMIGFISPVISAMLTGMPAMDRLPFMILELCAYGAFSGLCYETFRLRLCKGGIYISLVLAMLFGRLVYGLSLVVATNLLQIPAGGFVAMINATVAGAVGIVLQLVFIPAIVFGLERSGHLERYIRRTPKSESHIG